MNCPRGTSHLHCQSAETATTPVAPLTSYAVHGKAKTGTSVMSGACGLAVSRGACEAFRRGHDQLILCLPPSSSASFSLTPQSQRWVTPLSSLCLYIDPALTIFHNLWHSYLKPAPITLTRILAVGLPDRSSCLRQLWCPHCSQVRCLECIR